MTSRLRRHRLTRPLAVLGAAAALAAGAGAGVAAAQGDTSAVAVNTKDGSSVFRLAFSIRQVMGDTVDQQNAAVAYASCDACQTVAISIQILLIGGDPTTFTPGNYAIAINQNCTLCDTLAEAYQFAVGIGTKLKFTADGHRQIADIRTQLEQLRKSGLAIDEVAARVDTLMGQLSTVLQTDLIGVNEPAGVGGGQSQPSASTPGQAGATTDTTTQPQDSTGGGTSTAPTDTSTTGTSTSTTPPTDTSTTGTSTSTTP